MASAAPLAVVISHGAVGVVGHAGLAFVEEERAAAARRDALIHVIAPLVLGHNIFIGERVRGLVEVLVQIA
jgi:hypothetical protein